MAHDGYTTGSRGLKRVHFASKKGVFYLKRVHFAFGPHFGAFWLLLDLILVLLDLILVHFGPPWTRVWDLLGPVCWTSPNPSHPEPLFGRSPNTPKMVELRDFVSFLTLLGPLSDPDLQSWRPLFWGPLYIQTDGGF